MNLILYKHIISSSPSFVNGMVKNRQILWLFSDFNGLLTKDSNCIIIFIYASI